MSDVYRTRFVSGEHAGALVIHCSDPTFQPHFQEFLREHLGLDHYALLAVPGGSQLLTLVEYLPKFGWAGWRWIKFLVDVARPTRVILLTHENCLWYRDSRFSHSSPEQQHTDLVKVRAEFAERFPGIAVELYAARHDGGHVAFSRL